MINILVSWLVLSLAVWVAAAVLDRVRIKDTVSVVIIAAAFGILNFFLGTIFFWILGLATLGIGLLFAFITRWVVDALLLKMVDKFTDHIEIDGMAPAFWAALIMSLFGSAAQGLLALTGMG